MHGKRQKFDPRNWVSEEYKLYLLCQHPPSPHGVGEGYSVRQSEAWWQAISPWLNFLIQYLKFAVPIGGKVANVIYDEATLKGMKGNIALMEEMIKQLPEIPAFDSLKGTPPRPVLAENQEVAGPALRALCAFLKDVDATQNWGGLHRILTPDGNILWLCAEHRAQYEAKPLSLDAIP